MKEYRSKSGGRYIFNEDIENLQELALSMTSMFKDSGVNFVISGCEITVTEDDGQYTITVGSGFAFINDKIVKVEEYTNTVDHITNLLIMKNLANGPDIMYADGSTDSQYDDYHGDVRVNFTNMGALTPTMRRNMLNAYTDDDDNWLFPNLKTGYFTHYGLNNDGLFVNVASQEQFTFDKNKVYLIGKYPAQYRLFDEVMPMDTIFDDEQLNDGFAAFVPKANVNSILTGIAKWYCYIQSDITAAINIVNSDGTFGEDVHTFRLTKRGDDYHTFTIDSVVVDAIEDGIENAPNYSGIAIRIVSGSIDINDSYIRTSKVIEFGVCKSAYPETLYRYVFDDSESTIVCTFINSVAWRNCSYQEKALWKETDVLEGSRLQVANGGSSINISDLVNFIIDKITNKKIEIVSPNNGIGNHGGIKINGSAVNGQFIELEDSADDDGDFSRVRITPIGVSFKKDDNTGNIDADEVNIPTFKGERLVDKFSNDSISISDLVRLVANTESTKNISVTELDELFDKTALELMTICRAGELEHYRITSAYSNYVVQVGFASLFTDNMLHQLTLEVTSNYVLTGNNKISTSGHRDGKAFTYRRVFGFGNREGLEYRQWSDWEEVCPESVETALTNINTKFNAGYNGTVTIDGKSITITDGLITDIQ